MKPVNFKLISVVIPAYGVKETLVELHKQLQNVFSQINQNYEIIMVNDACPVGSWDAIETICKSDKNVKGVNLARNFGQHPALACGLAEATGDWIIVMDCDLQDDPANITALIERAKMGFDVVLANPRPAPVA